MVKKVCGKDTRVCVVRILESVLIRYERVYLRDVLKDTRG